MFNVTDSTMLCRLARFTVPRLSCRLLATVSRPRGRAGNHRESSNGCDSFRPCCVADRCNGGACAQDWPRYQKLSDKITGDISENTRKQLEKGKAANSLMKKMSYELSSGHHGRVLALSGEYRSLLGRIVRQPHRFYFNNYMIMFYSYWIKHGNKAC